MASAYKVIPQDRPETTTTRSSRWAEDFNRDDAEPLGTRRVIIQVMHDLYGTKDVQDVITASYVWLADQIGHVSLGLLPTLFLGWIWRLLCDLLKLGHVWEIGGYGAVAIGFFILWVSKERQDYHDTFRRAVKRFPFDSSDIWWNVKTALLYFGIGGLLALGALIGFWWFVGALLLSLWPAIRVAFWWLRRKLAFQQAGLPYLYRLTNFSGQITDEALNAVTGLSNLKERPVALWRVLFTRDLFRKQDLIEKAELVDPQHLLITGPLRSGKTSLAVGIGTEFAFALGFGRYFSAAKLMELMTGRPDDAKTAQMDYDDGRVLWPLAACDLLIIDDVDGGLPTGTASGVSAETPEGFAKALRAGEGAARLAELSGKRTVWVLGNTTMADQWKKVIAGLMGVGEGKILTIRLQAAPLVTPHPAPPAGAPAGATAVHTG